ncbi:MAG: DUF1513 domain-containing protein [Burkholderiales bacterium]|nr:DUF1513 domain-containing protein [Burkholderiales bacterium]
MSKRNTHPLGKPGKAAEAALRAAGHAGLPPGSPALDRELFIGGGAFVDLKDQKTQRFVLSRVELDSQRVGLVPTTFLPHGVALDPRNPARIIAFEKIGPGCCEIDLATGMPTRTIEPREDRWFYGHGAFSADGRTLFSTETVNSRESGVIGVRDADTLEYLGEFPTFGENPHDCHLIDEGKVLVVTNGGGRAGTTLRPCVTYVDIASQRLLDKFELDDERFNTGHLALSQSGILVVVSAPRKGMMLEKDLGAVSMRAADGPLRVMREPGDVAARMFGEALSVKIHEPSGIAAVTHPFGGMVTFWSLEHLKLLKTIELQRARGLTLSNDGRYFVISYDVTTALALIDPYTLELVADSGLTQSFMSGSHLFNWNRLAGASLGTLRKAA